MFRVRLSWFQRLKMALGPSGEVPQPVKRRVRGKKQRRSPMKKILLLIPVVLTGLMLANCSSNNSPGSPGSPALTATFTSVPCVSASQTPCTTTPTFTSTATTSPTLTATFTATRTPTSTATYSPTPTVTATPTMTASSTPTGTPTHSPTITSTATATSTPTITSTPTVTPTFTPPSASVSISLSGVGAKPSAVRAAGADLWFTDIGNQALQEWTTTGSAVTMITAYIGITFSSPNGVGIDPKTGNVYAADSGHSRFVVFGPSGNYLAALGGTQLGTDFAYGVAVNSGGTTVYGVDYSGGFIYAYSIGGTPSAPTFTYANHTVLGALGGPQGLSLDSSDHLWVADNPNHRLVEFDSSLNFQAAITLTGGGTPSDVAVDASSNLFTTDTTNNLVQEFSASGQKLNQ